MRMETFIENMLRDGVVEGTEERRIKKRGRFEGLNYE